jgi:hypothetical protein
MLRARPSSCELLEDLPGRDEVAAVAGRQWPVDEEQVHVIGLQRTQRLVECAPSVVRLVKAVVQLAGDEHVGAVNAGVADAVADFAFVAVHLGDLTPAG